MATLQTLPENTTLLGASGDRGGASAMAVRTFLYAVFKHRRLVIGIFLLVFLGSVLAAFLRDSKWLASSKVLVKLGETVQLAPAEAPSRSINMPMNQEVVKTEADIVKSNAVVEAAVKKLNITPETGTMADLIAGLQAGLTVTPTPGMNTLSISFLGRDPERAARFVNTVTDLYIEHHNAVYRHDGMGAFYGEQLVLLESQMKAAQEKLRTYLRENNITDPDQEMHLLTQDIMDQDKALKAHRAKILATQRKQAQVQDQIAKTPQQLHATDEYAANPTQEAYKGKLAQLEIERLRLLELYMPEDRSVRDIESQIAKLKERAKAEQDRILSRETVRYNEMYAELLRNSMSLQTLLADAQAREPSLAARLDASRDRLTDLRDKQFIVANLVQEADQKKYAFDSYFKKQEEARITEAMTDQSVVNVSIVDKAIPPVDPQNGIILPLLLGMIGGLALAASTAVAIEFLGRRLRFEEEVERYLEIPVLAVIPDLETAPELGQTKTPEQLPA